MRFFSDSSKATKGRLGDSSLEDWASFLENSPTEQTSPHSGESKQALIGLGSLHRRALAVVFICWIAFVAAMVFGFILLTSLATPAKASDRSSTVASPWASGLDGWMGRRLWCFPRQPCDAWSPFSEDGPSNLRYVTLFPEVELVKI